MAAKTLGVEDWPREWAWCTALVPALADGSHRRSFGMIYESLGPRTAEHAGYLRRVLLAD